MGKSIIQVGENTFTLTARGSQMTLEPHRKGWRMKTINASTRVWGMGGESWKEFETLAEVEKHYKSWRGISALVDVSDSQKN